MTQFSLDEDNFLKYIDVDLVQLLPSNANSKAQLAHSWMIEIQEQ
jgi:hypothetical protein